MDNLTQPFQALLTNLVTALPGVIAAVIIFLITLYLAALVGRAVSRSLQARAAGAQAVLLLSKISRYTIIVIGTIVALQQVGFNLTAFLTGLGIAGFTIGFALQDVSKNFISGVLLLVQRPFEVGDAIQVVGFTGTVVAVDLRATEICNLDGTAVLIPNSAIFTNPITNYSRATRRRVDISIGVSYDSDLELVRKTALQAVASAPGLLQEPSPSVLFQNFGGSTIDLTIYFWVDVQKSDPFAAKDIALVAVNSAFQQARIDMPYPTQTLLLKNGPQISGASS
jgi:small conductance mechanosensitive channel